MKILAFDTSSSACSVALYDSDKASAEQFTTITQQAPMQQGRLILPLIKELLDSARLRLESLDAIAYGRGPGSFTGNRIASSVAQGLSFGASLPVIGISSMAALAQAVFMEKSWSNLLIALDARMNHVYWAAYQANADGYVVCLGDEKLCAPHAVCIPSTNTVQNWYGVGDGWNRYDEQIKQSLGILPEDISSNIAHSLAKYIIKLAISKLIQGKTLSAHQALPVYISV